MDHLLSLLEKDLDELTLLKGYVENEALVFHKLQLFGPALTKYITTVRLISSELSSMRENLDSLLHNDTQAKFVQYLRPVLGHLAADIEIINFIIGEYMTTVFHVRIYPTFIYSLWDYLGKASSSLLDLLVDRRWPLCGSNGSFSSSYSSSPQSFQPPMSSSISSSSYGQYELEALNDNDHISCKYFDSHSRSRKIKYMHDRRTYFRNNLTQPEEESFLNFSARDVQTDSAHIVQDDIENYSVPNSHAPSEVCTHSPLHIFYYIFVRFASNSYIIFTSLDIFLQNLSNYSYVRLEGGLSSNKMHMLNGTS